VHRVGEFGVVRCGAEGKEALKQMMSVCCEMGRKGAYGILYDSIELSICKSETRKENHGIHGLFLFRFRRKTGQIGCNLMSIRPERGEESNMKYILSPLQLVINSWSGVPHGVMRDSGRQFNSSTKLVVGKNH
jgi:hypothetical protein